MKRRSINQQKIFQVLRSPTGQYRKGKLTPEAKAAGWLLADAGPYTSPEAHARAEHLQFCQIPLMTRKRA